VLGAGRISEFEDVQSLGEERAFLRVEGLELAEIDDGRVDLDLPKIRIDRARQCEVRGQRVLHIEPAVGAVVGALDQRIVPIGACEKVGASHAIGTSSSVAAVNAFQSVDVGKVRHEAVVAFLVLTMRTTSLLRMVRRVMLMPHNAPACPETQLRERILARRSSRPNNFHFIRRVPDAVQVTSSPIRCRGWCRLHLGGCTVKAFPGEAGRARVMLIVGVALSKESRRISSPVGFPDRSSWRRIAGVIVVNDADAVGIVGGLPSSDRVA